MFCSGGEESKRGVAILLAPHLVQHVESWEAVSDRVMTLTVATTRGTFAIVAAYAPTEESTEASKDSFYATLEATIRSTSARFRVVMGDFNAKLRPVRGVVGEALTRWQPADETDNGTRLSALASAHGLKVANSFFSNAAGTWQTPDGKRHTYIDHVLVPRSLFGKVQWSGSGWLGFAIESDHNSVHVVLKHACGTPFRPPATPRTTINREWLRNGGAQHFPRQPSTADSHASDEIYDDIVRLAHTIYTAGPRNDQSMKPWICTATLELCRHKDKIHQALKTAPPEVQEALRAQYQAARRSSNSPAV
jgi:hypothetical protein